MGRGDAFLHIGALQAAGYETVPPGAKLKVQVGQGQKGTQVTRVLEVDTSTATPERSGGSPAAAVRSKAVRVRRGGRPIFRPRWKSPAR